MPERAASGHRWYQEATWTSCSGSMHRQRAGVRLEAAIREVRRQGARRRSVFAMLRRDHWHLAPQRLRKPTLLGLSQAIEDEYLASAEPGVVCASFQRARFYDSSRARWSELAVARAGAWCSRTFRTSATRSRGSRPGCRSPLSSMRREWAVVAETSRLGVCLAGWETPGQDDVLDRHRTFEVVWTIDPRDPAGAADLRRSG